MAKELYFRHKSFLLVLRLLPLKFKMCVASEMYFRFHFIHVLTHSHILLTILCQSKAVGSCAFLVRCRQKWGFVVWCFFLCWLLVSLCLCVWCVDSVNSILWAKGWIYFHFPNWHVFSFSMYFHGVLRLLLSVLCILFAIFLPISLSL